MIIWRNLANKIKINPLGGKDREEWTVMEGGTGLSLLREFGSKIRSRFIGIVILLFCDKDVSLFGEGQHRVKHLLL
jgi:hypothetical protein